MAASSVTGIGHGSAEGLYRGYDLDMARKAGIATTGDTYREHLIMPITVFTKNQQDPPIEGSANNLAYYHFLLDTHHIHGTLRVPTNYVANWKPHVHWTKSQNTNQSGKTAQWKLSYTLFNGQNEDATATNTDVLTAVGTYQDAGTTNRVVYTVDFPTFTDPGIKAGAYMCFSLYAVTPSSGTPLTNPALVLAHFIYDAKSTFV